MRLAMFPLGDVVLPGQLMPLRVFESRYRQLLLERLAADPPEFGTALIERGSDVGGGDQRASIGTCVSIRTISPAKRGQFHVLTVGTRRLSVLEWLDDDPYPNADVEDWPDRPPATDDERAAAAARLEGLAQKARDVSDLAAKMRPRPVAAKARRSVRVGSDLVASAYRIAASVPLGPADRFRILQAPSLEARLDTMATALDDLDAALRFRLGDEQHE